MYFYIVFKNETAFYAVCEVRYGSHCNHLYHIVVYHVAPFHNIYCPSFSQLVFIWSILSNDGQAVSSLWQDSFKLPYNPLTQCHFCTFWSSLYSDGPTAMKIIQKMTDPTMCSSFRLVILKVYKKHLSISSFFLFTFLL